jgi:hypothetical protein
MRFCQDQRYSKVYLTTLPGLDAAFRLYAEQGFVLAGQRDQAFHGSRYMEQVLERRLPWTSREGVGGIAPVPLDIETNDSSTPVLTGTAT